MEPFIGQIQAFGFNFAPRGWAQCNGQIIAISSNTSLFALLATTYGGDGRTTFALPDLRGRSMVHIGLPGTELSGIRIGERGGRENMTLNISNLPSHTHTVTVATSSSLGSEASSTRFIANNPGGFNEEASGSQLAGVTVGNTGGQQAFSTRSPYLGINICIALIGIYPSRS
ncbi:phage tail protein [Lutibacter citreus]|uniref:phage tail protein n=1 Tax=Lutibacter citreus TaxID=2138210 RepID=UPI000DBE6145|nr:tail fiber protein [Lutibacter citreus]